MGERGQACPRSPIAPPRQNLYAPNRKEEVGLSNILI